MSEAKTNNDSPAENPVNTESAIKFYEDRQIKVWKSLSSLDPIFGPGLASMYEGAIISMREKNPEKIHIVCHLARELSSILPLYKPDIPMSQKAPSTDQVLTGLRRIENILTSGEENTIKILEIVKALTLYLQNQQTQKNQLRAVVNNHPKLSRRPEYLNEEFVKQWMIVHKFFVKNAHYSELKSKNLSIKTSEGELTNNWRIFEELLYRILVNEPFFNAIAEIDRLISIKVPDSSNADELVRLIVEHEHRRYFFDQCSNSNWLALLNQRGAFSRPQEPIKQEEYIQFVVWPESQYLARIAAQKPQEVYNIIKNISSDNPSVLDNFMDAAINSPVGIAALYVKLIKDKGWMLKQYIFSLPDKAVSLIEKLSQGGKFKESISLAYELFKLRADKSISSDKESDTQFYSRHPNAKPYYDEWQFGEIVKKKIKTLATAMPAELFKIYSLRLSEAIEMEGKTNKPDDFYEFSHIWRPNLTHAHGRNEDAKNILVDGLLNLIEQNKDDVLIIEQLLEILSKKSYALFRRLEMFVLNLQSDKFLHRAEKILKDKKVIYAYNLRREYLPLLGKCFNKLSPQTQKEIIESVNAGPNIKRGAKQSKNQFDHICANWLILYLTPIEQNLPDEYKKIYTDLVKKYGKVEDDDGEIKTWVGGNSSPISIEELEKMTSSETVKYLSEYTEPSDPFSSFSSSGLGMNYSSVVSENPQKYVANCLILLENKIRPLYVYQFLYGLKEAIKNNRCFNWEPVTDLCLKMLKSDLKNLPEPLNQYEQNWHSVKRSVADLFGDGLGLKNCEIPAILRDKVWEILLHLTHDEEPTVEDERREGVINLDPMALAINSVRGEAMHAVITYGLWLARQQAKKANGTKNKMPEEMQQILDYHLNPSNDPSLAIRSIYGSRLPNIYYLDSEWAISKIHNIFPQETEAEQYLISALEGYLSNRVYGDVFNFMKDKYKFAIPLLGKNLGKAGYRGLDIDERLPQHLMVAFINYTSYDDLIEYFFKSSPAKIRGEAISFVGRVMREKYEFSKKDEMIKRIGQLWDTRLASTKDTEELTEFGWWFKNAPFDRKTTMARMQKTLELTNGIIDAPYEIIEELQNYASEMPLETITALSLIAKADREHHEYSYKKKEYAQIIRLVKMSGDVEATKKADDIINFLGSKGFIEFRELL